MAWEGDHEGYYFRLSLFDIEKLIKSGGGVRAKRSIVVNHGTRCWVPDVFFQIS